MNQPIDAEKQFATLQAQLAIRGHTLHRADSATGPVTYFAQRWGLIRHLATLNDVERFLAQIGGCHG